VTGEGLARVVLAALALFASGGCRATAGSAEHAVHTGYAPVNGIQIWYEDHDGAGSDATPLVLLHGGGSTIETSFAAILPGLARTRRVIAFEQQGHGHTADADRPFSFAQSAEDTVALLRWLKIEKFDLYGYSNGGHIAIQVALAHPDVVRKLVIESAMFSKDGCDPAFWSGFDDAKLETMPAELREAYLKTAPHPEQLPTFFAKSVERMKKFKGWTADEIRSIRAPTLILLGDHDIVRPEHAVEMFRLMPDARLAILPATDHAKIVDRAAWELPMIEDFLDAPMPATP